MSGAGNGHDPAPVTDFIDCFMAYTEGIPSPELFRLWSAISAIAGALERRIWVETGRGQLYPNLYVLLVAPPGVGKDQAISRVEDLWYATKRLFVAPDSVTSASLLDSLAEADRKIVINGHLAFEYHSLVVPAAEFGVLVPAHDTEFLSRLNKIFDCPRALRVRRKYIKEEVSIIKPQLNILAGSQPGFLASLLPEEAWSMGFTSRLIMIYANAGPTVDIFGDGDPRSNLRDVLLARMESIASLNGLVSWELAAMNELKSWHLSGGLPKPEHTKLTHYNARRTLHLLKLAMIASVSRGDDLTITLADLERAKTWLFHAEYLMPDIFRDMVGRSDAQIIQEMHYFMWRIYAADKQHRPIHSARIVNFLTNRVPSEKLLRIIEIAERSNVISRQAGTELYVPRPRNEHGGLE